MFVGIDIGTSSSKGVVVAPDGQIVARAAMSHDISRPHPGWAEHNADDVWWRDFTLVARRLMEIVDPRQILGVGVSGLGPCVLPADERGRPLRAAILYGIDSRAVDEMAELTEELGAEEILDACGAPITTQAVGPKLRWLSKYEPDVYSRIRKIFSCSSYIVYRLTGNYIVDHSTASQFLPLYDLNATNWHSEWSSYARVAMPQLGWPAQIVGSINSASAAETGLPEGTPVNTGTLDACAESFSVGVRKVGDTMVMYGTTIVILQVVEGRRRYRGLWLTNGVLRGTRFIVGSVTTSGAVASWISQITGMPLEGLISQAETVPPGSRGLILLPYFSGERTPFSDPYARGVLVGLNTTHTPADLYRAALEGTAYAARNNLDLMLTEDTASHIMAVGGGTSSRLWVQIVSDVTGRIQHLPHEMIGAALGNAMLIALGTGHIQDPWRWNTVSETVIPDSKHHVIYNEYYHQFTTLYDTTRETSGFLALQQRGS